MEIERKWKISGFPDHLPLLDTFQMRQSYLSTCPVVRVRESISTKKHTFILCFKGHGTLVREEIELPLEESIFRRLEALTGHPPITKELRLYALSGGLKLEVSCVDKGLPTEFYYAEVEFDSVESANAFSPLPEYGLGEEMTESAGFSMSHYWQSTRPNQTHCLHCGAALTNGVMQCKTPLLWALQPQVSSSLSPSSPGDFFFAHPPLDATTQNAPRCPVCGRITLSPPYEAPRGETL